MAVPAGLCAGCSSTRAHRCTACCARPSNAAGQRRPVARRVATPASRLGHHAGDRRGPRSTRTLSQRELEVLRLLDTELTGPRDRAPAVRVASTRCAPTPSTSSPSSTSTPAPPPSARAAESRPGLGPARPESHRQSHHVVTRPTTPFLRSMVSPRPPGPATNRKGARHDRHPDLPHPVPPASPPPPPVPIFIGVQINHPQLNAPRSRPPSGHPRLLEGADGRARAGRHHRHVPEPGPPQRRPRADRLSGASRRLPRHHEHRLRRRVRPAEVAKSNPGLRQRRHRRRHRRGTATGDIGAFGDRASRSRASPTWPAASLFGIALYRARVLRPLGGRAARRRRRRHRRPRP